MPSEAAITIHPRRSSGPRPADASALAAVRAALGPDADCTRRDLLIEHLHQLQDRYLQLRSDHLAALAELMKLSLAEVHEVASFYHHFDIVYADAQGRYAAPAALTVRVCDGIACELAGAQALRRDLPTTLPAGVRVIAAPCIGRCEQAPAAVVHQHPIAHASVQSVQAAVQGGERSHAPAPYADYAAYTRHGGWRVLDECLAGTRGAGDVIAQLEASAARVSRPGASGASWAPNPARG
jgi:NADH:ubiquinone oxidoreductase subunit E